MKLHEDKGAFISLVRAASDRLGIKTLYVEKDYWVTYALKAIFENEIGAEVVFKGGTALEKCHNVIKRFSEDIDLVVLHNEGESGNQLTKKIRRISAVVGKILPEVEVENITRKMGMNRKTAHAYEKEFAGDLGQIRDVIIIEATWFGYFEPFAVRSISSFVGEMMIEKGQEELAEKYGMEPFEVRVLEPTRTICEKIMSLVRFSYSKSPIADLRKKLRHCYDLHQLLKTEEFAEFFASDEFSKMLLRVANDDVVSFRNNNSWLAHHPKEALIFREVDSTWKQLATAYRGDFRNVVYGELPDERLVAETLRRIAKRLSQIHWSVQIPTAK